MVGLEYIKDHFLSVKDNVKFTVRQNTDLKHDKFSASLIGNPGRGEQRSTFLRPERQD